MKNSFVNTSLFCFLYLVLSLTTSIYGQTINPQILQFERICAGIGNEFNATFTHSAFPPGTGFDVILSDSSGSFVNPINTTTLSTTNLSVSPITIKFAVPNNLVGSENYKLRVKSTTGFISGDFKVKDPVNIGGTLNFFPAYFKSFEGVYFINNKIPTASICTGGNVTLSIDNPTPNVTNSSPVNYPNIKYKWYKETTVIPGATGSSYIASSAGTYYVAIDYGLCTDSNSRSNAVTVNVSAGGSAGSVSSSQGNPFCSSSSTTLSSTVTGNTYQWLKNNATISGATNPTYTTDEPGLYSVKINFGGCSSNYTIDLKDFKTVSTINIPNETTITEGETKTVVVTTNALNPSFQWYKDNTLITDNNTNTYNVTSSGNYEVQVTQNSICVIVDKISFDVNSTIDLNISEIPNLISPNQDGVNDTWYIPQEYINNNTAVIIMDNNGKVVFTTDNYLNTWPESPIDFKSINPVYYYTITKQDGKVKKGSITLVK